MFKSILFAMVAALASVSAQAAQDLSFCGGAPGGAYYALANSIGKDIVKVSGGQLEVVETGGSMETAQLMRDGDCAMGIMQAGAASVALRGY